jgi:hypothetical protein
MDDIIKIGLGMLIMTGFPLILYGGFVAIRAFQRKLDGQPGGLDLKRELEDVRTRLADLEQAQGRVEELEERLDFAERMLAQDKKQLVQGVG